MENQKNQAGFNRLLKKLLLKMKLTLTILLFCLAGAAASTYSQNTRLDVKIENGNMIELVKQIEAQSEFMFYYQKQELRELDNLTVEAHNATVMEILDKVTEGTEFDYTVIDRYIVVRKVGDDFGNDFLATAKENTTAQQRSVSGKVTDSNNQPLPGVTVVVKGTTQGTITNADGEYTLPDIPDDATLVFSFVGMLTKEVEVTNQTTIDVTMEVDAIGIEEVVAIGYGVQKKTTVTGSISTIAGEDLAEIPVPNISQSMAGKLAGVSMRPNGGQPGFDDPDIHIRGIVTTGNNAPLVVVDGVKRNNIRQIDPNIIESITILKDAAAVAPYGIGGANGVILITTKRGTAGEPVLKLSSSYSIQNPTYLPDMLNAKDYMALQNEGYYNMDPDGTIH
jgi:TonB-dependent starch-binding outer membrane protein SusC